MQKRYFRKSFIENFPRVSIILLNWNGWKDTIECLESLYQITYPNYDVIVVDNGSEDESIEELREYCKGNIEVKSKFFTYSNKNKPINLRVYTKKQIERNSLPVIKKEGDISPNKKMILIKNDKNYGFAEGNNIGIRFALKALNSDYVLLLNNDTIVDKEFLSELVNTAESKENIGIVGAVNYYYHNPKKIWYSGAVINWTICKIKDITKDQIDNGQFNKIREVDDVPGSSLLIKLEVIKKIGLLFSEYYCNFEETEWCVKAKKNGYTIYANLNSKIWHKVSQSTKEIPEFQIYYMTRNRFIFMYRNASRLHFISFLTYYLSINFILTNVYFVASKKKFKLLKTYYNAIYDGIILVRKRGLLLKK